MAARRYGPAPADVGVQRIAFLQPLAASQPSARKYRPCGGRREAGKRQRKTTSGYALAIVLIIWSSKSICLCCCGISWF